MLSSGKLKLKLSHAHIYFEFNYMYVAQYRTDNFTEAEAEGQS